MTLNVVFGIIGVVGAIASIVSLALSLKDRCKKNEKK